MRRVLTESIKRSFRIGINESNAYIQSSLLHIINTKNCSTIKLLYLHIFLSCMRKAPSKLHRRFTVFSYSLINLCFFTWIFKFQAVLISRLTKSWNWVCCFFKSRASWPSSSPYSFRFAASASWLQEPGNGKGLNL